MRVDGRDLLQYREVDVAVGVLPHTYGSVRKKNHVHLFFVFL